MYEEPGQIRWYKFGDRYLYQKVGIPIGGPVSGIVLEAVLSVDEYIFEKCGWEKLATSIGLSGPRENWLPQSTTCLLPRDGYALIV